MSSLAAFQQSFASMVWGNAPDEDSAAARCAAQPAFAIYRNTVMKGCIDALEANHPAVSRLVGEAWFRSVAAIYVRQAPPIEPRLVNYGIATNDASDDSFAGFLARFEPAASLPYLPGVARLDAAWAGCHVAADASSADPGLLASMDPQDLGRLRLRPHPAARWAWFDSLPISTIWSATREGRAVSDELAWQGEGALLTRPLDSVQWSPLPQAGCALLDACAAGAILAEAAEAAQQTDPECDLAALLALLLRQGAFSQPILQGKTP